MGDIKRGEIAEERRKADRILAEAVRDIGKVYQCLGLPVPPGFTQLGARAPK